MLLQVAGEWSLETLTSGGSTVWFAFGTEGKARVDKNVVGDGVNTKRLER